MIAALASTALAGCVGDPFAGRGGDGDRSGFGDSAAAGADASPTVDRATVEAAARRAVLERSFKNHMAAIEVEEAAAVRAVLMRQQEAWNAGDTASFMLGYARSPDLRFASGGEVTTGWIETLRRYDARYPDRAAMGYLTFSDLDIRVVAPDAAVIFGRWRIDREVDSPHGLFTLIARKIDGDWKIVHDHTSAAD